MPALAKESGSIREDRDAAVIRIATESSAMLGLVEGSPEFGRLASILEHARSEALRILTLHGLSLPPALASPDEPGGRRSADRKRSPHP